MTGDREGVDRAPSYLTHTSFDPQRSLRRLAETMSDYTTEQQPSQPIIMPASAPISIPSLSLSSSPQDDSSPSSPYLSNSTTSSDAYLSSSPTPSTSSLSSDSASTAESCCETCCPSTPILKPQILPTVLPPSSFQPLIIVGAGPHSLALAARLAEPRPAALYTDLEHARLSWLRREKNEKDRMKRKTVKGHWTARKLIQPEEQKPVDQRIMRVLDSSKGGFMGRWDSFFASLRLTHLRSPMIFHPNPNSADALVAYARRMGREEELMPIEGVVGAERSKYQRKKRWVLFVSGASVG